MQVLQRQLQATIGRRGFKNIELKMRRGVVTITGLISDSADRESIVSLIASTSGVRAIDAGLRVG